MAVTSQTDGAVQEAEHLYWFTQTSGQSKLSQKQEDHDCYKSHSYPFMSPFTLFHLTIFFLVKELPQFICPLFRCVFIVRQSRQFIFRNQLENRLLGGKKTKNSSPILLPHHESYYYKLCYHVCKQTGTITSKSSFNRNHFVTSMS